MADYTQTERALRVSSPLGEDVLLLAGFTGAEGISQPFSFQLDLLSTESDLDPAKVLRQPLLVSMNVTAGETRFLHGVVSRFAQLGMRDDLAYYRAEIVPWLWFLTLSRESRMYQDTKVPDILEQVFKRLGYSDFEFRLTRTYQPRPYCVQYRETHFAFVSRLMEEEGIFYFFEHTDEKHLLVITDDSSGSKPVLGPESVRFSPEGHTDDYVVSTLEREHRVHPGRMTLWEYDYLKPSVQLQETQGDADEEVYDYPGGYREQDDGDRLARLLLEAEEAERQVVRGTSDATGLVPGCHFKLEDHFQRSANGKYLVTRVQHQARSSEYRAWAGDAGAADYRNEFSAIPHATPYRPRRRTPKPLIHGSQSALVVGPSGEELHVDQHGRIKVHFYWDRDSKRNEKSSCWIRVSTPWGGKGWGSVSLPRIGNEVVVAFEEGDPDRPIVIGSVYNAEQTPPFQLPGSGIQMGMKSRSSPGGGGMNEITMTDTKGKEKVTIHAQYDMGTAVEHDQTNTVSNNRTTTISVNDTQSVGSNQTIKIGSNRKLTVGANQTIDVGANETISVSGSRKVTAGGKITNSAGSKFSNSAGANFLIKSGGATRINSDSSIHAKAGAAIVVQAGGAIKITGGGPITLKCGGSSIKIGPGSIDIKSPVVKISGDGQVAIKSGGPATIKGAVVQVN